jgi:ubiquinone/menaquinone biosynthesis C-methylase UbiE
MNDDAVRARFAANADRVAEASLRRLPALESRVAEFVQPTGDERVLDVGTGTGPLAFALAPLVREVVGVDLVPELLERARAHAGDRYPNVQFVEGDVARLDVESGAFDLVCERAVLHHVPRPELVLAEMTRATRPDGRLLVVDQLAPIDPFVAIDLDRFERARDPSHTRLLPDADIRGFLDANDLVVSVNEIVRERREISGYLDLAGLEGAERERVAQLAPEVSEIEVGWYVARKP